MKLPCLLSLLLLSVLALGCAGTSGSRVSSYSTKAAESDTRAMFFPPPLADDWTKWIVGEWEGGGGGNAGTGRGTVRYELTLGGQFLVCRGQGEITELDPDYLKKHMRATDAEIERFRRSSSRHFGLTTGRLVSGISSVRYSLSRSMAKCSIM